MMTGRSWENTAVKTKRIATIGLGLTVVAGIPLVASPIRRPEPPRPNRPVRFFSRSSQPNYYSPPTYYNQIQSSPWPYGSTDIYPEYVPSYNPTDDTPGIAEPYDTPGLPYIEGNLPEAGTLNLQSTYSYTSNDAGGANVIHITNRRSIGSPDQVRLGNRGYIAVPEHR